jgi:UDP-N-acetylmuramate dehydrogenase
LIINKNISLKPYNTFGIDVIADNFVTIQSEEELYQLISKEKDFLLIGGGSNILLLNDIKNLVVHINTKGKKVLKKDKKHIYIRVAAGENWHEFVTYCVNNGFGGIENLAKIPGNVGTSPIQNIGAYGVEVKDVIEEVHTLEIETTKERIFSNTACQFGYRDSFFKHKSKRKYIITAVTFKLTINKHKIHIDYGVIQNKLAEQNIDKPSIKDIAKIIEEIRTEKLPDPEKIGNSGSFFKNPIVSQNKLIRLQKEYPNIPNYPVPNNLELTKLAACWLIDQCGFKGMRIGDAGVHKNQALVLVNYGNTTGHEILDLAKKIQDKVFKVFGVTLEMEVNIIDILTNKT